VQFMLNLTTTYYPSKGSALPIFLAQASGGGAWPRLVAARITHTPRMRRRAP